MNAIQEGQMNEAQDLGIDPTEVGCDCNSDSLASRSLDFGVGFDDSVMRADLVGFDDSVMRADLVGETLHTDFVTGSVGFDDSVMRADLVGRATRALRRRGLVGFDDSVMRADLVGHDDSVLRTDLIGRATAPHYSRALRRRLMACRTSCEADLVGIVGETLHTDFVTGCAVNGCSVGADVEEDFWSSIVDEADLADLPNVVGFSFNPIKAISNAARGVSRAVKSVPGLGAPFKAATSVLNSSTNVLQKVLSNPFVSTFGGPFVVPGNLLLATYKGGAKGALELARKELHNPIRQMAVKAVAVVFPPAAPAAAAYEAAQRIDDALRSKDPVAIAKAVAQVAATTALAETGDAGALKGLEFLKKVKAVADKVPVTALTPMLHSRPEVCGAKSEESRGLWLKSHIRREGDFLLMTIYSVANANAEVVNLKVDLVPILKAISAHHQKLHGGTKVSGLFENLQATALKLGRAKLTSQAFAVSRSLAGKAACKMQTPDVPVSDLALTAYAAARKGVDAVERNKSLKIAMQDVSTNINRLIQVKAHLAPLSQQAKTQALRDPTVKSALLKGIGSKFALANFIKAGGPEKAKVIRKNAMIASKRFAALAAQVKTGNPDAKKMAAVVKIAAKTQAKTQHAILANHGSTAGLVIDSKGKVHRNAKGFKKRGLKAGERPQVFIPQHGGTQTGVFDKVSGGWVNRPVDHGHPMNRQALAERLKHIHAMSKVSGSAYNTRLQNRLKKIRAMAVIHGVTDPGHINKILLEQAGYGGVEGCVEDLRAERHRRRQLMYGHGRPLSNLLPFVEGATHSDVRSPTRTEVRSPTRTRTEVRSPTSTSTEVRSPTSTSTEAYTQGNFTLTATGGAGAGATHVTVNLPGYPAPPPRHPSERAQLSTPPPNGIFDHISDPRPRNTGIFDNVKDPPGLDEDGNHVSGSIFDSVGELVCGARHVRGSDVPLDRRVYDLKTLYRHYLTQSFANQGSDIVNADNDRLEYDTFVEDPYLEEEIPADLAGD